MLGCPSSTHGTVKIENIFDGTSTTILCTEVAGRPDLWVKGGCGTYSPGKQSPAHFGLLHSPIYVISNPGGCWGCIKSGLNYLKGTNFYGTGKVSTPTKTPVCFFNCTNEKGYNAVYSFHPGSGGVAFTDGSAHMLSEDIGVKVMCSLLTYDGREPVSDNF